MILCLDVGNTQMYGGLFVGSDLKLQFRNMSKKGSSSDELGLFLRGVLRENGYNPDEVKQIAICSVVPEVIHSLRNCCVKYFSINPFILGPGVKCGLQIKYRNPLEVGADRIANSIAAVNRYPNQNLIIADFGTAATFCAITARKEYLGGAIVSGLKISMEALEKRTAKLPRVEIVTPQNVCGRSTIEGIQSGLFYGHMGIIKEITQRITEECFNGERPLLIGTGGFSRLYADHNVFDVIIPDLVLAGLYQALEMNS